MTVPSATWEQVRQRASFACEYCAVTETDAGGQLTVDHFQPKTQNGTDDLDNLIYCCFRCNLYKHNYWPGTPDDPQLWNPRREPATRHFVELGNGSLHPLTLIASFTIRLLRLNRPPLVAWRFRRRELIEESRLLERYRDLLRLLAELDRAKAAVLQEQQRLLAEQRRMLDLLLGGG